MTTSTIFQPLQMGPLTLKNRVLMAPLTRSRAIHGNVPNDVMVEYYRQRSNAGLIVTEGVLVSPQGVEWPYVPGLWNEEQVEGWKKVVDAVHAEGSHIFAQIWHVGRNAHPDMPLQKASGLPVYGPSAIAAAGGKYRTLPGNPGHQTPTAIENPSEITELFRIAAVNAKKAGFDGVEVQADGGYVIAQFLDSGANQRTDKWGGSIENRARFGLEVIDAVVEVWGADRVGAKVSPTGGYGDVGMPLEQSIETFTYFLSELERRGLAYVTLARHLLWLDPTLRGTVHDVVATYRHLFSKTKAFSVGGFSQEEATEYVETDKLQGVFFGIPWISHPDLATRMKNGKPLDNTVDPHTYYGNGVEADLNNGYTDYPAST